MAKSKMMKMDSMGLVHMVAFTLTVIGAVSWGLVALFNFNIVHFLFGLWASVEQIIYIVIGLSAVYVFITHQKFCIECKKMM